MTAEDYGEPFWVLHDPDALDHLKVWIMEGLESEEPDVHIQAVAYLHSEVDLAKRFTVCANALKGCPDPKAFVAAVSEVVEAQERAQLFAYDGERYREIMNRALDKFQEDSAAAWLRKETE